MCVFFLPCSAREIYIKERKENIIYIDFKKRNKERQRENLCRNKTKGRSMELESAIEYTTITYLFIPSVIANLITTMLPL